MQKVDGPRGGVEVRSSPIQVGRPKAGSARTLLKRGGRILDINGSAAKMARSVSSGDFKVLIAKYKYEYLELLSQAAARGQLNFPIARSVPLTGAIDALTELEHTDTPKGGKLVINLQ